MSTESRLVEATQAVLAIWDHWPVPEQPIGAAMERLRAALEAEPAPPPQDVALTNYTAVSDFLRAWDEDSADLPEIIERLRDCDLTTGGYARGWGDGVEKAARYCEILIDVRERSPGPFTRTERAYRRNAIEALREAAAGIRTLAAPPPAREEPDSDGPPEEE